MDWTELGLEAPVIEWLEAAESARYARDRRLDPYATSMRDFDDAAAHLQAIRNGAAPQVSDVAQRITDLKNAGLSRDHGTGLTVFGTSVLTAWERYNVDTRAKDDELARLVLMTLEAAIEEDPQFLEFLAYWKDLRTYFDAFELIHNWDTLYQINYLDFERKGFVPGLSYRDENVSVSDIDFNLAEYAREIGASERALQGAERIEDAIGGKLPRGRHRSTVCMALEMLIGGEESAQIILDAFGFPKRPRDWTRFSDLQKEKIFKILLDYKIANAELEKYVEGIVSSETVRDPTASVSQTASILPADVDFSKVQTEPPKLKAAMSTGGRGGLRKVNYQHRAEVNEAVGKLGEAFAIEYERWRLKETPELLRRLRHVSTEDDTLGYDIESFTLDGTPRYVEVKSTLGPMETRFFVTSNELVRAQEKGEQYVILRVAQLADKPKCCEIQYPFDGKLVLSPTVYSAVFVSESES